MPSLTYPFEVEIYQELLDITTEPSSGQLEITVRAEESAFFPFIEFDPLFACPEPTDYGYELLYNGVPSFLDTSEYPYLSDGV